jgi:hypothetical protein
LTDSNWWIQASKTWDNTTWGIQEYQGITRRRGTKPEIMQTWKIHVSERKNHYLLVLSVHDEGYSRNERSALNLDRSLTSRNQSTLRLILTTLTWDVDTLQANMWISTEYLAGINSQRESTMRYDEQNGIGRYKQQRRPILKIWERRSNTPFVRTTWQMSKG